MELISFIVRLVVAGYVIYRLYLFLWKRKGDGVWDWIIPGPKGKSAAPSPNPETHTLPDGVVGASRTVCIPEREAAPQPVDELSIRLEVGQIVEPKQGTLPAADDVEMTINKVMRPEDVDEQDLFMPLPEPEGGFTDEEFSSGLTFDQIAGSVDVLQRERELSVYAVGGETQVILSVPDAVDARTELEPDEQYERELYSAAQVFHKLQGTELLDCIVREKTNAIIVGRLLDRYMGANGQPLPVPAPARRSSPSLADFDISRYI